MAARDQAQAGPRQAVRGWLSTLLQTSARRFIRPYRACANRLLLSQVYKCLDFARRWDYGGVQVVNLFALRSTDPRVLKKADDPVGLENDRWIENAWAATQCFVCAWGAVETLGKFAVQRVMAVERLLLRLGEMDDLFCLGRTANGMPRHPLYCPKSAEPIKHYR